MATIRGGFIDGSVFGLNGGGRLAPIASGSAAV
jgi:hypothetical protein